MSKWIKLGDLQPNKKQQIKEQKASVLLQESIARARGHKLLLSDTTLVAQGRSFVELTDAQFYDTK